MNPDTTRICRSRSELMNVLRPQTQPSGDVSPSRMRLSLKAEQLLKAHLDNPLTIREVCTAIGVPSRTLHVAFLEYFGVPPKRYVKILRLNAARNELRDATARTTVTGVAMRWSFFHLSRFSQEYWKMFGEWPSTTLRRQKSSLIRRRPI